MLADVADEHELKTGRRQEGIFFGGLSLAGKLGIGMGNAVAGFVLTLIRFPTQAEPGTIAPSTLHALGFVAGPGVAALVRSGNGGNPWPGG